MIDGKSERSKRNEGKRWSLIELGLGETIGGDGRLAEFGRRVAFQWVDDRQQEPGRTWKREAVRVEARATVGGLEERLMRKGEEGEEGGRNEGTRKRSRS